MNSRLNFILLFIVAILIGWYISQPDPDDATLGNLIKQEGSPDYTGNRISTSVFDLQGKPQYYAEADEIKHYDNSERTEFFNPFVNLFDQVTALKQWKLSADHAEVTKEKLLNLVGNVKLDALDPTSRLQKIETDKLTIDLNTQDISTDSVVKSTGLGFTTTGTGLKGNLKQQVATLLKDVKSYIEPTVIKTTNEQNKINSTSKDIQ